MKNLVVTCAFVFKPVETVGVCQQVLSILVYVLFKLTENHAPLSLWFAATQLYFQSQLLFTIWKQHL